MTKACPPILDRTVLPLSELMSIVLDGQLYPVGEAFATPDTADTPWLRARVFAAHRPGTAVADRRSAAWIHGARSSPPPRPQVCIDPARRSRPSPAFDFGQHALSTSDIVVLSGVRVTGPLRTAADLLLTLAEFTTADALEAKHLLLLAGATTGRLHGYLLRCRRVGMTRALSRLPAIERARLFPRGSAQPALTRYTS